MLAKLELEPPIGPLSTAKSALRRSFLRTTPASRGTSTSHSREGLHGLHEFKAVVLKKEGEGRAVHATAKAVVEPFFRDHVKGGRLLRERGIALEFLTRSFQFKCAPITSDTSTRSRRSLMNS